MNSEKTLFPLLGGVLRLVDQVTGAIRFFFRPGPSSYQEWPEEPFSYLVLLPLTKGSAVEESVVTSQELF